MGSSLDAVPFSGIIRIRDMMYSVERPFRLDQGDVSFDAPESVKAGMRQAIAANHSHYLQTTGVPRLLELLVQKLRTVNGIPVGSTDEVFVTNGGIHGLYLVFRVLLEPGDEVIIPDPQWPPTASLVAAAGGVVVRCPLHEDRGWRLDVDELAARVTPRTRAIYLNSPQNPTGGMVTADDAARVAALARERNVWVVSDEAYEDVVFDAPHVSVAALEEMYRRTLSVFTFSKSYAMTGLRMGYLSVHDPVLRERLKKLLFLTTSNASSVVQYGAIGALEGSRDPIEQFRVELRARRDLFYEGIRALGDLFTGDPPAGAFYAFLRFNPDWRQRAREAAAVSARHDSASWELVEYLITRGRIGCVPGADFGPGGEGCVRFCFARDRQELEGALASMRTLFA